MGKTKKSGPPPTPAPRAPKGSMIVALPFSLLALLRIGASFMPEARLWGLHALAYLPLWAAVLLGAAGVLFASPLMYGIFAWKARTFFAATPKLPGWLLTAFMVLIGGAFFWFFRMETYFLGDGAVYLSEIFRYTGGSNFAADVLFSTSSAPLTGMIIAGIARFLFDVVAEPGSLMASSQSAFWISGVAAGMVYIALSVAAARSLFKDAELRFGFLLLLLFTPALLFFFGYVEYYTLFFIAGLAWFTTLTLAVRRTISIVWPVAMFVLMCSLHFNGLVALPSLVLLLVSRDGGDKGSRFVRPAVVFSAIGVVLVAAGVYYFASGIAWEGSRIALALQPFGEEGAVQQYTLLSSWHLADVLNLLFLLGAPVIVLLSFVRWKEQLRDTETLIAVTNLLFFSFLLFFGYTCFGMARDWDVNALWALALLFVLAAVARDARPEQWRYRFYLAAGAAMTATLPWIAINVTTDSSVQRFRHIMALDDTHVTGDFALNGYEHLRKKYWASGDSEGLQWAIGKKIDMVGYRYDYAAYLSEAMNLQDGERVRTAFDFAIGRLRGTIEEMDRRGVDSLYAGHRSDVLERYYEFVLEGHNRSAGPGFSPDYVDQQMEWLRKRAGGEPVFRLVEEFIASDRKRTEIPFEVVEISARSFHQSPTLAVGIAAVLVRGGKPELAIDVLQRSFTLNPEATLLAFYLAETELKMQPPLIDAAARHLRALLAFPEGVTVPSESDKAELLDWARKKLKELEADRK